MLRFLKGDEQLEILFLPSLRERHGQIGVGSVSAIEHVWLLYLSAEPRHVGLVLDAPGDFAGSLRLAQRDQLVRFCVLDTRSLRVRKNFGYLVSQHVRRSLLNEITQMFKQILRFVAVVMIMSRQAAKAYLLLARKALTISHK